MKLIITTLFLGLLVVACCPKITPSTTSSVRDSIIYRETVKEVKVLVPGDTIKLYEFIQCDSVTNLPIPIAIHARGKKAHVHVTIDAAGKLTAIGGCDSLTETVNVLQKENYHLRTSSINTVKVISEYKTHRIDLINRWIVGIEIFLGLIYLIFKLKTFFI